MKRRDMLLTTGAAALGLSMFPLGWTRAAEGKKQKILYFTRSAGFPHSVVTRNQKDELSFSEKIMVEMGQKHGIEVVCSKDGTLFDGDIDQFDCFAFYTSGDETKQGPDKTPPMTLSGKTKLLDAIAGGKGFVAFHAATDTFHTPGKSDENQSEPDPFIAMIGGEFLTHGLQQKAKMRVVDAAFPSMKGVEDFALLEEWYSQKNFAKDLHVILVQDTESMATTGPFNKAYNRPPFPATWARRHGKGRVYYTSMGHREDIWTNPLFQKIAGGGFSWALGNVEADVTPNIEKVTPGAWQLHG